MTKRVCLLTGASGLLGTAFIARYADRFTIAAVHHRELLDCASQDQVFVDPLSPGSRLAENDHAVHSIRADLAKAKEIDRTLDEVTARFGQVDLLVNAAALRSFSTLLRSGALDAAEEMWRVNVDAPLRLCVGLATRLWRRDPAENERLNRNVVNVSSTAGLFVYPDRGQALYGTTKAALNHLTYHLASELWDLGVRINAVAPNTFPDIVPTERVLEAIVSLDASAQTGQVLRLERET